VQQPTPISDRRRHPRHSLYTDISVELRVEVSGDKPAMLLTRGMVSDISCGGLRCHLDLDVPVGTRVDVCFPDGPDGAISPASFDGKIVRSVSVGGAPAQIAVVFGQPLEQLDMDALHGIDTEPSLRGRTAAARRASWADEPGGFPAFATGSLL